MSHDALQKALKILLLMKQEKHTRIYFIFTGEVSKQNISS